jgi:tetratricopeptide (TPR) repeat protein
VSILEKALGPDHPWVGTSLNNVAALYESQGRYAEAEPLYKRTVSIYEKALGPDHPDFGQSLNNLARLSAGCLVGGPAQYWRHACRHA